MPKGKKARKKIRQEGGKEERMGKVGQRKTTVQFKQK
jgi:hypothetical protein